MKVAFLSDIHSNIEALEAVLDDFQQRKISEVYCLGDLVGYGPDPNMVVERVKALNIPCVMGNFDDAVGFGKGSCGCSYQPGRETEVGEITLNWSIRNTSDTSQEFLKTMPKTQIIDIQGVQIHLVHGSPTNPLLEYLRPDTPIQRYKEISETVQGDVMINGHTHLPMARFVNGIGLFNCGSVGRPKDGDPRACYLILDIHLGSYTYEFVRVPYPVVMVCEKIAQLRLPPELGTVLALGQTFDMGTNPLSERAFYDFPIS